MDNSEFNAKATAMKNKVKDLGSKVGTAIKAGFLIAGAAAAAFAVKGIAAFTDFESKMAEVSTLLPDLGKEGFEKLKTEIRELAAETGTEMADMIGGLYDALSAGVPEDNVVSFLADASKLAVTGATDLNTSVDALTTVLNGYGLEAEEAGRISGILFGAVGAGKTTLEELAPQIGRVTPLAASLGISFEEVAAATASMTSKLGGNTPLAMTKLAGIMRELGKEGTMAANAFLDFTGVSFTDFMEGGGTFEEAMSIMAQAAEKADTSILNLFSSAEAGEGALILMSEKGLQLGDALGEVTQRAEGFDAAFAKADNTTARMWDKTMSAGHEMLLKIGEAFAPFIQKILPMFTGMLEALPSLFNSSSGGASVLSAAFDALAWVIKFVIKVVATIINTFGGLADIFEFVGSQIAVFVKVFIGMGRAAFSPIIAVIMGVIDAFKALGDILANPFSPESYEKAWDRISNAGGNIVDAVKGWGKSFGEEWDKNAKEFKKNGDKMMKNMDARAKNQRDIWAETGKWGFLAGKAAEAGANDAANAFGNAAGNAQAMAAPILAMPGAVRQTEQNITRNLVRALARGAGAAGPLADKMKEIQERSKEIAKFWADAAAQFAKVAGGKLDLKIQGWKGQDVVNRVVRQMGDVEAALRMGANRVAALAPEAMAQVMKAFEENGRMDAAVLRTMYENAQRAQDMTIDGFEKLNSEIEAMEDAARQADVPIAHLAKTSRQYFEWLKVRRDIAEEGLQQLLNQMNGLGDLQDQLDLAGSILGNIHTLEGKKDAKSLELLKAYKEKYAALVGQIEPILEDVKEQAGKIGLDPAQINAIKVAENLLEEAKNHERTTGDWLEEIANKLETIQGDVNRIAELMEPINEGEKPKKGKRLSLEETQEEVLSTLQGFFINQ